VVNTPASYCSRPESKSRPRRPAILIKVSYGFPQSLHANVGDSTLKLAHNRFKPNLFQFISTLYNLVTEKRRKIHYQLISLMLFPHPRLGLPNGVFTSGFLTKPTVTRVFQVLYKLYALCWSPILLTLYLFLSK
jgi:hypothetical protein